MARLEPLVGCQAARIHLRPGLRIHAGYVVLENGGLDAPLAPTAHFDRGQLTAAHEGIGLGGGDVQCLSHVGEGQEAAHDRIVPNRDHRREGACG